MRKASALCLFFALATTLVPPALAQSNDMNEMAGPPKVLQIIRESVKPGKAYTHTAHEAQWTRAMTNAKYDTPLLALTSTTGANEAWFLIGYDSFASLEKEGDTMMKTAALRNIMQTNTAPEAEYLQDSRTLLAVFRPDLSYKPGGNIGEYRYFSVGTLRVRLGQDVAEVMKIVNDARERGGYDYHTAVYQVVSGAPNGTFLSFHAMKSLSEMDTMPPQAYQDALKEGNFAEVGAKVAMSFEPRVFEFSPAMSNPSKEMVAANPSFWKTAPMKKAGMPTAKKEAMEKK